MKDYDMSGGPFHPMNDMSGRPYVPGISVRDWLAGQALASIHGINPSLPDSPASLSTFPKPEELARRQASWSYLVADAMIAERSK